MSTYDLYAPEAGSRSNHKWLWMAVLVFGGAFLGKEVAAGGSMVRVLVALLVMGVVAIPAIERPRGALMILFAMLPFLGMFRHMFLSATGKTALDPLLLLTSGIALLIMISLTLSKQMDWGGTTLSKIVFFLLVVGLIQVFNPNQKNILIGLTGIMINLIPITFFFIARSIADAEFTTKVTKMVLVVGAICAGYGLVQVFIGLRGFEKTWIASQGYTAAKVGGTIRPFSTFNNGAEYAAYIHIAFCAAAAAFLFSPKTKRTIALAIVGLIGYSGFLIGSRGFTVKVGLALIILLAARAKNRFLAAGIVSLLIGAAVFWSMTSTSTGTIQEKQVGSAQLVEQQLRALKDPFDRSKSTLPVHLESATIGIKYAVLHQPWGIGVGSTTRGGAKFGGVQAGTELDIGDAFLGLGLPGGILYVLAIFYALRQTNRVRRALPGPVWIGIWAMAATSIGAWLIGGNYAVTPLIWFMIGAADGAYKRLRLRGLLDDQPKPHLA